MVSCQEQCHDKLLTPCTVLPSSANRIAGYCALLGKSTLKNSSVIWKMSSLGCLLNGYGRIKNHVPLCWSWLKPVEIHGGSPFFFLSGKPGQRLSVSSVSLFAPLFSQCFGEVWSLLPSQKTHPSQAVGLLGAETWGKLTHNCSAGKAILWRPLLPC